MGSSRRVVLYDWAPSPFCMKVRMVLAHKGVAYEKVSALGRVVEVWRRGGVGKAPALELDGEFIVDSTDICLRLEREFPERPVLPDSPRDRALCHVYEEFCDESLYFLALYHHWHEPEGRRRVQRYFARTWTGRLLFRPLLARIERQLAGHGTSRKSPEQVRRDLERNLDALEASLEGGELLLGGGPWLCDFALAAQLVYLTLAPATRDVLAHRPNLRGLVARCPSDLGR